MTPLQEASRRTGLSCRRLVELCREVEWRHFEREKALEAIEALSPKVSRAEQLLKEARAH